MAYGTDRVEDFIGEVDHYEPASLPEHEDNFRIFARFISRSLDARYLNRHPAKELIPDLEALFSLGLKKQNDEIKVQTYYSEHVKNRRAFIMTCMPDTPFIVSTILLSLKQLGVERSSYRSCVVPVERRSSGELSSFGGAKTKTESFLWVETDVVGLENREEEIIQTLKERLESILQIVEDFSAMKEVLDDLTRRLSSSSGSREHGQENSAENVDFLEWLIDENFVFFGAKYIPFGAEEPSLELGTGRYKDWRGIDPEFLEDVIASQEEALWTVDVRKSRKESYIYRGGPCEHLLLRTGASEADNGGIWVFEGLFSHQAKAQPKTSIPKLKTRLERIFSELDAKKGTHRYRTIRSAFNSFPLEYLFTLRTDALLEIVRQFLESDAEHGIHVYITQDHIRRFCFAFVVVPRSQYSEDLRADVRALLQGRFSAKNIDGGVFAGEMNDVTCHFFITGAVFLEDTAQEELRADVEELAKPWSTRLLELLTDRFDAAEAKRLHRRYTDCFPGRYREETSIRRAVDDIVMLEGLPADGGFDCDLYQDKRDRGEGITRLRMVHEQEMLLSDILPALDNLGLTIIDEYPTTIQVPEQPPRIITTFRIRGVRDLDVQLMTRRNRLKHAVRAIMAGAIDNHPFNRILLQADLPWSYVALLRAYQMYFMQIGSPYTILQIQDALGKQPEAVRALTEIFRARFDPSMVDAATSEATKIRHELAERAETSFFSLLDGVQDLLTDQVLRTFHALVLATVRTNFFSRDPMRMPQIVLKFESGAIPRIPPPAPFREIYVHHPRFAGLHLRGGSVARGGIRWSDRPLDFRTEVLGLMATQDLKNVVIVPKGAKGSFVLRAPPKDPSERRMAADRYYREFISSLLSITDTRIDGKTVSPEGLVIYDQPDPYLVVAADKGTAHLSDTANEVARDFSFWLGDAFASGGSQGYDHKKEGITAKGAWESVKRHFRECNQDPEKDRIRVVGIGDMSGDVFGNGLLLSKTVQLVAAFDHRHIFLDPDPDPEKSYTARKNLFDKGRSSWEDYPKSEISEGGGVYPRSSKSVPLSSEIQSVLGIQRDSLSGDELIQAILLSPVDLLWNGGIGTYIKSKIEEHIDVGDPANDSVRVDAERVRVRVVGEGGNLGLTSLGRIALASRGVAINTDAIDNSAGVDLSDHEVNLKILFQRPLSRGEIQVGQRDEYMEDIRLEVDEQVLSNNWVHSRMLSLDVIRSQQDIRRFGRAIEFLAKRVPFNRREQFMPGERILAQRDSEKHGLYRPELAVLTAFAKQYLRQELADSSYFDGKQLEPWLIDYFPQRIVERFSEDVRAHPLGTRIAQTMFVNHIIADAGSTFVSEATLRLGCDTETLIRCYTRACDLLDAAGLKRTITNLESSMSATAEYALRLLLESAIEKVTYWFIRYGAPKDPDFSKRFRSALSTVQRYGVRPTLLREMEVAIDELPETLCESILQVDQVEDALDVATVSAESKQEPENASAILTIVGASTGITELLENVLAQEKASSGDKVAWGALANQLRLFRVEFAKRAAAGVVEEDVLDRAFSSFRRQIKTGGQGIDSLGEVVVVMDRIQRLMNTL